MVLRIVLNAEKTRSIQSIIYCLNGYYKFKKKVVETGSTTFFGFSITD